MNCAMPAECGKFRIYKIGQVALIRTGIYQSSGGLDNKHRIPNYSQEREDERGRKTKNSPEKFWKNGIFHQNYQKILTFSLLFKKFLKLLRRPGAPPDPPTQRPPYKSSIGGPRFPLPKKFLLALLPYIAFINLMKKVRWCLSL